MRPVESVLLVYDYTNGLSVEGIKHMSAGSTSDQCRKLEWLLRFNGPPWLEWFAVAASTGLDWLVEYADSGCQLVQECRDAGSVPERKEVSAVMNIFDVAGTCMRFARSKDAVEPVTGWLEQHILPIWRDFARGFAEPFMVSCVVDSLEASDRMCSFSARPFEDEWSDSLAELCCRRDCFESLKTAFFYVSKLAKTGRFTKLVRDLSDSFEVHVGESLSWAVETCCAWMQGIRPGMRLVMSSGRLSSVAERQPGGWWLKWAVPPKIADGLKRGGAAKIAGERVVLQDVDEAYRETDLGRIAMDVESNAVYPRVEMPQ